MARYRYSKYRAQKTVVDGLKFDSKKEAKRWQELKLLQQAGEISNLRRQVKFELLPTQRDKDGKLLEYPCSYIADFVYKENGETVVEDSKGIKTDVYRLKRKMMLFRYGIRIKES